MHRPGLSHGRNSIPLPMDTFRAYTLQKPDAEGEDVN